MQRNIHRGVFHAMKLWQMEFCMLRSSGKINFPCQQSWTVELCYPKRIFPSRIFLSKELGSTRFSMPKELWPTEFSIPRNSEWCNFPQQVTMKVGVSHPYGLWPLEFSLPRNSDKWISWCLTFWKLGFSTSWNFSSKNFFKSPGTPTDEIFEALENWNGEKIPCHATVMVGVFNVEGTLTVWIFPRNMISTLTQWTYQYGWYYIKAVICLPIVI